MTNIQKSSGIAVSALLAASLSMWVYQTRRSARAAEKATESMLQKTKNSVKESTISKSNVESAPDHQTSASTKPLPRNDTSSTSSVGQPEAIKKYTSTTMSIQSTPKRKIIARKAPIVLVARPVVPKTSSPANSVSRNPPLTSRLPLSPLTSNSSVSSKNKSQSTKRPKPQKKRIRVRDSCLPTQLRQTLQAARASEHLPQQPISAMAAESIRPPSKRTVQEGPQQKRRQIRVRDSLLPASVRHHRKKQLGLLLSPSPSSQEGVVLVSAPRRQVMLRTPPVGIRRLSPTRTNRYEPPRIVKNM